MPFSGTVRCTLPFRNGTLDSTVDIISEGHCLKGAVALLVNVEVGAEMPGCGIDKVHERSEQSQDCVCARCADGAPRPQKFDGMEG